MESAAHSRFPLVLAFVAGLALAAVGAIPELQPVPKVLQIVGIVAAAPVIGLSVRRWGVAIGSHALLSAVAMSGSILFDPPGSVWAVLAHFILANFTALLLWALSWPLLVMTWSLRESREILRGLG